MLRSAVKYFTIISLVLFIMNWGWAAITTGIRTNYKIYSSYPRAQVDSDSTSLPYPFTDRYGDRFGPYQGDRGLFLHDPSNVKETIEYDPKDGVYYIDERMGNLFYRNPSYLTFDEFVEHEFHNSTVKYWRDRSEEGGTAAKKGLIPKIFVKSQVFDRIFGGNTIDIRPQGSAELTFGVNISKNDNPALPEKQRKITTFDFKEKIQMNVIGNIGDKMKLQTNYNTEATFDFENKMKLEYTGYEDEIIKKIEAGNVSLPLRGTLITGSQSLFGLKTELQFGRMTVTSIFSQQKGESRSVDVQGGAQTTFFEVKGDQYEANRHYFLAQYFRNQYDRALSNLPIVQSGVNITKIEVWVTNRTSVVENTRDILAFTDLGEGKFDGTASLIQSVPDSTRPPSDSSANSLYTDINNAIPGGLSSLRNLTLPAAQQGLNILSNNFNFTDPKNVVTVNFARKLNSNEYTLNPRLGYISLNQALNADEVLAVAFEYTLNGHTYHVGDFSTSGINAPQALFVKMLKSTNVSTNLFTWDLMMKNIYSLGTYNLSPENFQMQVLFLDDNIGSYINYIPDGCALVKGIPLLTVFNLDRLNNNNDQQPDGVFDFVDGITVNRSSGRIMFPEVEPFGTYLQHKLCDDPILSSRYVYYALYDSTKSKAQQQPEKNKFMLRGSYQGSSGSDIPLNAVNIPEGSVKVTAGGVPLTENVDYTVDYTLGRVKIINEGLLSSNSPIHVSLESNALFSIQTKTLLGSRFDYTFNKDFAVGATIMRLTERPLTNKITIGDEPIANTIWGVDGTYRTGSRFLTKLVDKIPFINTKEESNLTFNGEFADLIPGHSKAIGSTGTSYIDDFEGSKTPIDIKSPSSWILASVPQDPTEFPESNFIDSLPYGFNRAKLAWYFIDPLFQRKIDNVTPDHLTEQDMLNHFVREIPEQEIFPNKAVRNNQPTTLTCLNLAYYPRERGPYNYDVAPTSISQGLNSDGTLADPASRWAGIMRKIEPTDFEASNIEFIEFWLMDPFNSDYGPGTNTPGGDLYFNLGNISEDILKDGRKSFENGLPAATNNNTTDTTAWGVVPVIQSIVQAFDNSEAARTQQDVGLDGLSDANETNFFSNYISQVAAHFGGGSQAAINAQADPSADDYNYFRSSAYDAQHAPPLLRYKKYNGMEGNSPTPPYPDGYPTTATNIPDAEDINRDNTLSKEENYYQYHVEIKPGTMVVGTNFITDMVETPVSNQTAIKWYHFKIPLKSPQSVIGNIEDFKSIRFARMFLSHFTDSIILRFARLDLVRSEWRKYESSLLPPGEVIGPNTSTLFDVSTVNIEENGQREPVNYVLPPGIERETDISTTNLAELNEQSLTLKVCDLEDGDARAAYKTTQFDVRTYKRLKMYIHAESVIGSPPVADKELSAFIRLGSDFTGNYYEYEVPLYITGAGSTSPDAIWPAGNLIDLEMSKLINAKLNRNSISWSRTSPYTVQDGNNKITVMGNPNISGIRVIMIGVRNIKDGGIAKCGEVWFDELRVSDFDEQGGWAATARVNAQLADFGTVALVGNRSTIGWGTIEQKVGERKKEDVISYDVSTSLELGKFFPERTGLKIPMYFGYAESFTNPQYNPLDPDVLFNNALDAAPNPEYRDSIKRAVQDYTQRKSINFTNVRKNKAGGSTSSHIYDVENFNFTYSYNEIYNRNITTEYRTAKTYRGAVGYNFQSKVSSFSPFGKLSSKSAYLRLIKDFNINYVPLTNFSFRTDVDRAYTETQLRNNNVGIVFSQPPTFDKSFTMNRLYDLKLDLTKSIKIDFNAAANARIDEPPGKIDDTEIRPGFTKRDSVRQNFWNMGRLTQYRHSANVDYTLPLSKLPLTDWVTVPLKYAADYNWSAAPLQYDSATATYAPNSLANTISNSQTIQVNPNLNFVTLYNKVAFLKKINAGPPPRQPKPPKTAADTAKAKMPAVKKPKEKTISPFVRGFFRTLMSIRTANLTYSETNGTLLPGFKPEPEYLGQDWGNPNAPGTGFIFGSQADIRPRAIANNWITSDTTLNNAFITTHLTNVSGRVTIEPFKNFRIELNGTRNYSLNHQEYFKADGQGGFHSFSPTESGNFTISWLSYKTSFVKDASDYSNATFNQFDKNRTIFSQQLGGAANGYGLTQQDVLTYSFLAAYTGHDASTFKRDQFPQIPRPNWRITYDGLGKLKWAQQYVTQVNLNHSYKSTYSVNSFIQNLPWVDSEGEATDVNGNLIPQYDIQQITITEQWGPLIGIDITWKNGLQTRTEVKRDRTVSLSYSNIQVTEVRGNEYVIGAGYRIKNFKLPFGLGAKNKSKRNDLNLKADFSYRNNYTIIRQLIQQINQPSQGNKTLSIKTSADYVLNERLNIRLFYDQTINEPFVSSSFPTSNTNIGLSLRFTIAQ
jgi:cell surface protein SprA